MTEAYVQSVKQLKKGKPKKAKKSKGAGSYGRDAPGQLNGKYRFSDVLYNIANTKENAYNFWISQNTLKLEMICEKCGNQMKLSKASDRKDGLVFRCRKKHTTFSEDRSKVFITDNITKTIRSSSWLSESNLSLQELAMVTYMWSQKTKLKKMSHELSIGKKTLGEWASFFRETCECIMIKQSEKIGGPKIDVELDESKVGKRKYHRGHKVDGQWIFGGREKHDKSKVFMEAVENRKAKTLLPIVDKYVEKGSKIHTDEWKAYIGLDKMGYEHITVNHSKMFKNPVNGACTNGIECDWRHMKDSLPEYGVKKGRHQGYLAEFLWRRKHHGKDLFLQIIKDANSLYANGDTFNVVNV